MKVAFKKLETADDNISISFDNKSTFGNYDKNTALTNGVSIPDECTDFGNIVVKTNKSEISDLVYEIPADLLNQGNLSTKLDKRIKKLKIPDGVTRIGERTFFDCTSLTDITIPDSVTTIGQSAFNYCEALPSINIPDGVTSIGNDAFYNCSSLTSITIPDSVTSISRGTFQDCSRLTLINYAGTKEQWNAISKGDNWNKGYPFDMAINYNYQV